MRGYFAYVRVSTVKQGERGSSLQEQKAAIENYARRHSLEIVEWFEEKETAAKQGRPVFTKMLHALQQGKALGVITHKIDRSARNLRDWARLGELLDRGIELHFAHESIDLSSRGGRLAADIQAVVAADYIRNLRDEVKKGFYGRLKQGLYPLGAPIGYCDNGGGKPKTIDPIRGPLIAKAFSLYATGKWSLDTLGAEIYALGLRTKSGKRITRTSISAFLNNPFYVGLIRVKKTGEFYQGVHQPLIDKGLFDRVQDALIGKTPHRTQKHRYRYQRAIRCATCGLALHVSRHKGHVYYRCQTKSCPTTCLREEAIDDAVCTSMRPFRLNEDELSFVKRDIDNKLANIKVDLAGEARSISLSIAAIDDRLGRLADAYVDRTVDRDIYLRRKEKLLGERAALVSKNAVLEGKRDNARETARKIIELIIALEYAPELENDDIFRDILRETTSNLTARQKTVEIAWANPFCCLAKMESVQLGEPDRTEERTKRIAQIIVNHALGVDSSMSGESSTRGNNADFPHTTDTSSSRGAGCP